MRTHFRFMARTAWPKVVIRVCLSSLLLVACVWVLSVVCQRPLSSVNGSEPQKKAQAEPAKSAPKGVTESDQATLAANAKNVFRNRCFACHGGDAPSGGFLILDHKVLLETKDRNLIVAGRPDESRVFQVITAKDDSVMPPSGVTPPTQDEIDQVRAWIAAGAASFPPDVALPPTIETDAGLRQSVGVD